MIAEITKQRKRADELVRIWDSYFPSLPVGVEYWMVAVEDWPLNVLVQAIKDVARKRVQMKGNMCLEEMLSYLQSSSLLVLKDKIKAGIYKADHFRGVEVHSTSQKENHK